MEVEASERERQARHMQSASSSSSFASYISRNKSEAYRGHGASHTQLAAKRRGRQWEERALHSNQRRALALEAKHLRAKQFMQGQQVDSFRRVGSATSASTSPALNLRPNSIS